MVLVFIRTVFTIQFIPKVKFDSTAGNIALAIWRGDEYVLNFLFANRLQF